MHHILIAESMDRDTLAAVSAQAGASYRWDYRPEISVAELERDIGHYDALIVRPKEVTETAIANATKLKLIVRGGAGVNSIVLGAAKAKGIIVENTPGVNSSATAECTMALLQELLCRRRIVEADADVWQGKAQGLSYYVGRELSGKHLALVGLGNIGRKVAQIATGYGMRVSCWTPRMTPERAREAGVEIADSLEALCRLQPDAISLHIPLLPETRGIFNAELFTLLKSGTVLINAARPQLVDVAAFGQALEDGTLGGYGIDGDMDQIEPFLHADPKRRGILLPHIGSETVEAMQNTTRSAMQQVVAFFERGEEINRVA